LDIPANSTNETISDTESTMTPKLKAQCAEQLSVSPSQIIISYSFPSSRQVNLVVTVTVLGSTTATASAASNYANNLPSLASSWLPSGASASVQSVTIPHALQSSDTNNDSSGGGFSITLIIIIAAAAGGGFCLLLLLFVGLLVYCVYRRRRKLQVSLYTMPGKSVNILYDPSEFSEL